MNGLYSLPRGVFCTLIDPAKFRNRLELWYTIKHHNSVDSDARKQATSFFRGRKYKLHWLQLSTVPRVLPTEMLAVTGLVWRGQ